MINIFYFMTRTANKTRYCIIHISVSTEHCSAWGIDNVQVPTVNHTTVSIRCTWIISDIDVFTYCDSIIAVINVNISTSDNIICNTVLPIVAKTPATKIIFLFAFIFIDKLLFYKCKILKNLLEYSPSMVIIYT